jgi:hypothetical protein
LYASSIGKRNFDIRYSISAKYSSNSPAGEEALPRSLEIENGVDMSVRLFEKGKLLRGCVVNGKA